MFRQVGNDADKLATKFGLLNKSFVNIKKDLSNGQGWRSFGNIVSQQDITNFSKFQQEFNNGVKFHKAFNDNLLHSHTYIQQQAVEIRKLNAQQYLLNRQLRDGKISQQEYSTAMTANKAQIQALTKQTQTLTLAQRASAVASKALGIALNTALNIGISLLINGIITWISSLVNIQKEAAEAAVEMANKHKEEAEALDDLKEEYIKICDSLDDEATKTEKLNEWKNTLVETYGWEKEKLEGVNLEREKGIKLIEDEIEAQNKANRTQWLSENGYVGINPYSKGQSGNSGGVEGIVFDKGSAIANAVNDMVNFNRTFDFSGYFDDKDISDAIKKYFKDGKIVFDDHSTRRDVYEYFNTILKAITDRGSAVGLSQDEERLRDELLKQKNTIKESWLDKNNNEEIFNQFLSSLGGDFIDKSIEELGEGGVNKDNFLEWKKNLLEAANGFKELEDYFEDYIADNYVAYDTYFDNFAKAQKKFLDTSSIGNQVDAQQYFLRKDFINSLSDEDLDILTNKLEAPFKEGLDGARKAIDDFKKEDPLGDVFEYTFEFADMAKRTSSETKLISTAIDEMNESGELSSETYLALIDANEDFANAITITDGKIIANTQSLKDLATEYLDAAEKQAIFRLGQIRGVLGYEEEEERLLNNINLIRVLKGEYEKANGSGDGGGGDTTDLNKEEFEKEYAQKRSLVETDELPEKDFYEWLAKANEEYFSNSTKYTEEYQKYKEEVYNWEKQREEDRHNQVISDLTEEAEALLDKNNYEGAISKYDDAIAENNKKINAYKSTPHGSEIFKDEIEELEDSNKNLTEKRDKVYVDAFTFEADNWKDKLDKGLISWQNYSDNITKIFNDAGDKLDNDWLKEYLDLDTEYDTRLKEWENAYKGWEDSADLLAEHGKVQRELGISIYGQENADKDLNKLNDTLDEANEDIKNSADKQYETLKEKLEKGLITYQEFADGIRKIREEATDESGKSLISDDENAEWLNEGKDIAVDQTIKWAQEQIDAIEDANNKEIQAMRDLADSENRLADLTKARLDLEKSKGNKNQLVFSDGKFTYMEDQDAVIENQKAIADLEREDTIAKKEAETEEKTKPYQALIDLIKEKDSDDIARLNEEIISEAINKGVENGTLSAEDVKWLREQTGKKETVVETPQVTVEQPEVAVTTSENKAEGMPKGKIISPDEFLKKYMGISLTPEFFSKVTSMFSNMSFLSQKQSYGVPIVPSTETSTTNNNSEKNINIGDINVTVEGGTSDEALRNFAQKLGDVVETTMTRYL